MNTSTLRLTESIAAQAAENPAIYGRVDFSITPLRFTVEPGAQTDLESELSDRRPGLLANEEQVARIRAYTMQGDPVADAYAALIPTLGFRKLAAMLEGACDHGLESVPDAPPELVRFIRAMEQFPAWLNRPLIEEGARIERSGYAHRVPFVIRSGFVPTFMNKYTALPMVLTGALSSKTAARRVKETATFFTATVMPDALDRRGAGFKSAAMVRLMHSMVRFNALQSGDNWDVKTYGIPIPQVDQMPVGFFSIFPLAQKALREGRTSFTPVEQARVEIGRYRCFLLGLPEDLLPSTPQDIVDILLTRHATLRKETDANCFALVRATMAADLTMGRSLRARVHAWLERGFSRVLYLARFAHGDKQAAAAVGVQVGFSDYVAAAATGSITNSQMTIYAMAARIPGINDIADRSLVRKLMRQLADYGHAEYATDAKTYRGARASG